MKPPIKTWIYKGYQFIKECNTVAEASIYTRDSVTSIRKFLNQNIPSKRGFIYSSKPLSEEELIKLPFKDEEERSNDSCKAILSPSQEIEVSCRDRRVFYLEKSKEERKRQLKEFIFQKLRLHWMTVPQSVSLLEKRFLQEVIDSL